jgi:long-chain acyl-CoA synthetase
MKDDLTSLLDHFGTLGNDLAVVRHIGVRRRSTTYRELAGMAERVAALLFERRIAAGERVVLWGENSAEWMAAFYGCMLRGVIAVPLDAQGTPEFAARIAADLEARLILGDLARLRHLPARAEQIAFESFAEALPARSAGPVRGLSGETPLQILFTSGTTGEPKGIVHTHRNVLASIQPISLGAQPYLKYERPFHPLRFLHTLPLSHVFGQTMGLWVPPIFAAEVHFESRLAAPRLIGTIAEERISVLIAVPRVLALMKSYLEAEYPELTNELSVARVRGEKAAARWWRFRRVHRRFGLKFWAFVTGGGALPAPVEEFWNGLGFLLVQGYGMTETAALITLNHPFHVARGMLGKPLPGREVKLGPDGEVLVRGAMISPATWSAGALHPRESEWLATGDLAETQASGDLRFLGRKSEVIVTSAGLNIHPEDLEEALDRQPGVTASAVVKVDTPSGPEACAVLALRGDARAERVVAQANAQLAGFQQIRRWLPWPEPDLPRTSAGKVKRAAVRAWAALQTSGSAPSVDGMDDWLLGILAAISGEPVPSGGDALRLDEDLRLDSLARVQLLAALEDRLGHPFDADRFAAIRTVGALRAWLGRRSPSAQPEAAATVDESDEPAQTLAPPVAAKSTYLYPRWPWWAPMRWLRGLFLESIALPLVQLLAKPRVLRAGHIEVREPLLIVANHVTSYDVPLLLCGLPGAIRRRTAVAMSGEMLEDFRHARNQVPRWQNPLGPIVWLLLTALFNVFPLPRLRDFHRSFQHAGRAMDAGFHVIVFPEGTRSAQGELARFRPGIGLLVKESGAAVLPVALRGLGELKAARRGWFRSGSVEVILGDLIRFSPLDSETGITETLHAEVQKLLLAHKPPVAETAG